ncbi:MAG: radical SAM family heme chaperone HemW [Prevotella sp.]|nr:radical SAM family heme chaperone HemW [Prevotella sp.]
MAGIYVHIPFCKSRCIYCGFYSTTHADWQDRYVEALCREMELRKDCFGKTESLKTVYFGGGTPSQLSARNLEKLFLYINKVYQLPSYDGGVEGGPEITLECNPDDVTDEFCEALRELPVNRVSLGAQTFDDARLKFLRRRHDSRQIGEAIRRLREAGIGNISVDLMFGFPDESLADWASDIDKAVALGVEHLSAYSLMYEEGTPLYQMAAKNPAMKTDEELERQMYELLIDRLENAGFEHYEISNFAKPGFRSRHNSSYWDGTPYVGLGAAAHSYDGKTRLWNVSDLREYVEAIERGTLPSEHETIDETTHYNDLVTLALRTREGINLAALDEKWRNYLLDNARKAIGLDLLINENGQLHLTRRGLFVSDNVLSDLIFT